MSNIQKLHADLIDRVEREVNRRFGGECDLRSIVKITVEQIDVLEKEKSQATG